MKPPQTGSKELTASQTDRFVAEAELCCSEEQRSRSAAEQRSSRLTGDKLTARDDPAAASDKGLVDSGSERELIEAAQRDPSQFARLYDDHFARVYGYIARRIRDRAAAEDLTADVFHQALANLQRFEWRGAPFGAWLIRIAANAIADRAKRAAREQEILATSQPDMTKHEDGPGIQAVLEEVEQRGRLFRLVDDLPVDQRRVVRLRFVEEKSIREIAQGMGRTEGAVKQLQFRALQNLRAALVRE